MIGKKRLGVVFSTATDYDYQTDAEEEVKTLEAKEQKLRVRIEKNGRGGKTVTIISGFIGSGNRPKRVRQSPEVQMWRRWQREGW